MSFTGAVPRQETSRESEQGKDAGAVLNGFGWESLNRNASSHLLAKTLMNRAKLLPEH